MTGQKKNSTIDDVIASEDNILYFFGHHNIPDILDEIEAPNPATQKAIDPIMSLAYLSHLDKKTAGGLPEFGNGILFSKTIDHLGFLGWSAGADGSGVNKQAAIALGITMARWMAEKPLPVTHYWAMNAINKVAEHLSRDIASKSSDSDMLLQTLLSFESSIQSTSVRHYFEPIASAMVTHLGASKESDEQTLNIINQFKGDGLIDACAEQIVARAAGGRPALNTLIRLYCNDIRTDDRLKASIDRVIGNQGYEKESFLIKFMSDSYQDTPEYRPGYGNSHPDNEITRDKFRALVAAFMSSNGALSKNIAKHIASKDDFVFLDGVIKIDMDNFFDKKDFGTQAKKASLDSDLGL